MPVKSLKYYFRESSIKREVDTWSFEDCEQYLQKHQSDTKQSNLLKKKLNIVAQKQGNLLSSANLSVLSLYLKTRNLRSNMRKIIRSYVAKLCRSVPAQERKRAFSTWGYNEIVHFLSKIAPKACLDSSHPKWSSICSYRDTGVYLWANGYDVKRPLGAGGFGCVWECDGKAVKIMPDDRAAMLEIISANKVAELVGSDKTGKCKKYFNYLVAKEKHTRILEGILAHGDLFDAAKARVSSKQAENKKSKKTIDSLLRQLTHVGKSLIALHKLGYSHNDVKPQNFLKVDNAILNASKAGTVSKDGKIHKHRTQLADFGGISKIPQTPKEERKHTEFVFTPCFSPKNVRSEFSKEAVEKRDVFALGASGLELLLSKIPTGRRLAEPRKIIAATNETIYTKYKLGEYYGGSSQKNIYDLLDVIRSMMNESYRLRPDLEKSLEQIKSLRSV